MSELRRQATGGSVRVRAANRSAQQPANASSHVHVSVGAHAASAPLALEDVRDEQGISIEEQVGVDEDGLPSFAAEAAMPVHEFKFGDDDHIGDGDGGAVPSFDQEQARERGPDHDEDETDIDVEDFLRVNGRRVIAYEALAAHAALALLTKLLVRTGEGASFGFRLWYVPFRLRAVQLLKRSPRVAAAAAQHLFSYRCFRRNGDVSEHQMCELEC
jgi:hypothetical protein